MHDHAVAAVIGVWAGYEDDRLYRRIPEGIESSPITRVSAGDVLCLPADVTAEPMPFDGDEMEARVGPRQAISTGLARNA